MFDSLSQRLTAVLRGIAGKAYLSEENIQATLREVRLALLDADVALEVVRSFTEQVRRKAIGQSVAATLNPGEAFVKVVRDELVTLMGERNDALNLAASPPVPILMAGLQGAGKTTTAAKLARLLIEREKKKVALVSADVYRPAAIEQLRTLGQEVGARFIPSAVGQQPLSIVEDALADARGRFDDVLIVDTAGRLSIDDGMMAEIAEVHRALRPVETLFVVDAMTGQDAANAARAFDNALPLTGVVLAKADGDARGGAALSVRAITGKPIKFIGVGEKTDGLEPFHPDRMASRILGMGDVLGLIEEVERKVDRQKAQRLARKAARGRRFDLEDFRDQLQQMTRMGGVSGMLDRLPGASQMARTDAGDAGDADFRRMEAMINSMTPRERRFPDTIDGSRKRRISAGSGTRVQDVNQLLKKHRQMQKVMRKASRKGGMDRMLRSLQAQGQAAQRPRFRR